MSWFLLDRNLKLLEPYDWKLSRTVLRGERGSNAPDLPGKAIASANMASYIKYLYKTVRKFFGEAVVITAASGKTRCEKGSPGFSKRFTVWS